MNAGILQPLAEDRFGRREAAHLLRRAGFGGSVDEVTALTVMGLHNAVEYVLGSDLLPSNSQVPSSLSKLGPAPGGELEQIRSMERRWLQQMSSSPRPLDERLALMWHDHFATSFSVIGLSGFMREQHALFRAEGTSIRPGGPSFAALARGIVSDAAVLRFLDADRNRKEHPNENLAREFMELFTLGAGNYTEQDVKEVARALTGIGLSLEGFVRFEGDYHDGGDKTILGKTGKWRPEDVPSIVLEQPASARHVARRLYRTFVAHAGASPIPPETSAAVIDALASMLRGDEYRLKTALRSIFASEFFYSSNVVGRMVKSPAHLLAGTIRELGTPTRDLTVLIDAMAGMGQRLFDPPTVAGWDPGLSWISTASLIARQNACIYLLTGRFPVGGEQGFTNAGKEVFSPESLLVRLDANERRDPVRVVDHLLNHALAPDAVEHGDRPDRASDEKKSATAKCSASARSELIRYASVFKAPSSPQALSGLLVLIVSLPEYQLC